MQRPGARTFVVVVAVTAAAALGVHVGADRSPRPAAPPVAAAAASADAYRGMLNRYCVSCHNQRVKTAEVAFDNVDLAQVGEHAELWEKAIRKLKAGMMPPPGARRPEKATADAFAAWLETSLDAAAAAHPDPGRVAVHRLNRPSMRTPSTRCWR